MAIADQAFAAIIDENNELRADIKELVEALDRAGRRLCKECARGHQPSNGYHVIHGAILECLGWPEHLAILKHARRPAMADDTPTAERETLCPDCGGQGSTKDKTPGRFPPIPVYCKPCNGTGLILATDKETDGDDHHT